MFGLQAEAVAVEGHKFDLDRYSLWRLVSQCSVHVVGVACRLKLEMKATAIKTKEEIQCTKLSVKQEPMGQYVDAPPAS